MTPHVTSTLFSMATGLNYQSSSKRLRHLPYTTGPNGTHFINLFRAIPHLKLKEDRALPILFGAATPLDVPAPHDAQQMAKAMEDWMHKKTSDHSRQAMVNRYQNIQRAFAQHIADATESSILCRHTEDLRTRLILAPEVARFVILADQNAFPSNFRIWAISHALTQIPQQQEEMEKAA